MRLEIITGPMFSGKSNELLRRLNRWSYMIPNRRILLFKPDVDTRSNEELVESRSGSSMSAHPLEVNDFETIVSLTEDEPNNYVIGIDEMQFFNFMEPQILRAAKDGADVIIAGLNRDYLQVPFTSMEHLMCWADSIDVLSSVCHKCGQDGATETKRVSAGTENVEIDTGENYEARHKWCL